MDLLSKYLKHYAESTTGLTDRLNREWQQVICIPAYDEAELLPGLLARLAEESDLLCILVCNSPDSAADSEAEQRTRQMASDLRRQFSACLTLDPQSFLLTMNTQGSHLLLLEHYGLPLKQGVGLARKLACDLACQLIANGKVKSQWIHNTDADVGLPEDYFKIQANAAAAAAIYPFRHIPESDSNLELGLALYDYGLHYYVAGLKWAGSPYAFHTIGSTLLINHRYYAMARGFPKRSGAEDFYLLNKLAKMGSIQSLQCSPILLSGRASQRAPFGTGALVGKFSRSEAGIDNYLFYHPACFVALKDFLGRISELGNSTHWQQLFGDELLCNCLEKLGLDAALDHARHHSSSPEVFQRHMHNWFDAFRTLKLIHLLRDKGLPSISHAALQELKESYGFIKTAVNQPFH